MSQSEQQRLAFLEQRDGPEGALKFAKQTYQIYKESLLQSRKRGFTKPHYASTEFYRRKFILSCVYFRRYICQKSVQLQSQSILVSTAQVTG